MFSHLLLVVRIFIKGICRTCILLTDSVHDHLFSVLSLTLSMFTDSGRAAAAAASPNPTSKANVKGGYRACASVGELIGELHFAS